MIKKFDNERFSEKTITEKGDFYISLRELKFLADQRSSPEKFTFYKIFESLQDINFN